MQTDYLGYAIAIVTFIIGLLVSYYFYLKSIRVREPVWLIKGYNVIYKYKSVFPSLNVTYAKKNVDTFSIAYILFYNRGAETITREDIDTVDHIRIESYEGVRILDASVLQVNNQSSQFTLAKNNSKVLINFDYLNKNQGAIIQVTHTGSTKEDIYITGDIKHVGKVNKQEKQPSLINRFLASKNQRNVIDLLQKSI